MNLADWAIAAGLFYPLWEAANPRLRKLELTFTTLPPAWDGLRLLYLSDAHVTRRGRRERNLERLLAGVETDLLLFGGDIDTRARGYRVLLETVGGVRVRLGRFATWGNTEHLTVVRAGEIESVLGDYGFEPLVNSSRTFRRSDQTLAVCAVDCPYSGADDIDRTLCDVPRDAFRMMLMHAPEGVLNLGAHRVNLILSGHTHGGQLRLPGLPALNLHTSTPVRLDRGRFDADALRRYWPDAPDDACMVIGTGIGTSTAPARLFCPPEVLAVTLRSCAPRSSTAPT